MAAVVVEPSILVGDATCPRCGHLLWFFQTPGLTHIFDVQESFKTKDRIIDIIAMQLGVDAGTIANNPTLLNDLDADSRDNVELVMLLEEELKHG